MLTGAPLSHSLPDVQETHPRLLRQVPQGRAVRARHRARARRSRRSTPSPTCSRFDHLAVRDVTGSRYALPGGRVLRAPGPFVRLSRTPVSFRRPAPAHRRAQPRSSSAPSLAHDAPRRVRIARPPRRLPFAGVKVADFSWIGVGPITAKYFADHGATVVRVETEHPADRLRLVGPFKDNIAGVEPLPVLRFVQHLEAVAGAQPEASRRPRGRQATHRLGGHLPRLVHRRDDGRARPRLRRGARAQSVASSWRARA